MNVAHRTKVPLGNAPPRAGGRGGSCSSVRHASDEGKDFGDVDWSVGADLEQWPTSGDWLGDFVIPKFLA